MIFISKCLTGECENSKQSIIPNKQSSQLVDVVACVFAFLTQPAWCGTQTPC